MLRLAVLLPLLCASCGDDSGSGTSVDAPSGGGDAAVTPDGGGGTPDGSGATPDGGGPTIDGASGTTDGGLGVLCGTTPCEAGQQCCVDRMGAETTFVCQAPDTACAGATVTCDGPEDCETGQHCCGSRDVSTMCVPSANACDAAEVCHGDGDCTVAGETCCQLPAGTGGFCTDNCPF